MSAAERDRPAGAVAWSSRWVPTIAAALAVALVGLGGGPRGLVVTVVGPLALLGARARLSTPATFAVGQVALAAGVAGLDLAGSGLVGGAGINAGRPVVWLAQAALFALLVGPDLLTRRGRRIAIVTLAATAGLVGVTAGALSVWGQLWAAALALATTGGLIAYGLHRLEQVRLGVVTRE